MTGERVFTDCITFFKVTANMISYKPAVVCYEMLYFFVFKNIPHKNLINTMKTELDYYNLGSFNSKLGFFENHLIRKRQW